MSTEDYPNDDIERYTRALHAMQSGVALEMNKNDSHEPKHLRVGINSAHVSQLGLINLLIEKGIVTKEEYYKAQADAMEEEVKIYEERWGVHFH